MVELLFTIAVVHFVALMTPGPDFIFVSQTAASRSRMDAMKGVLGIVFGVAFWASLTLIGMHWVFEQFQWLPRIIQLLGGIYLIWLGYLLLMVPIKHIREKWTAKRHHRLNAHRQSKASARKTKAKSMSPQSEGEISFQTTDASSSSPSDVQKQDPNSPIKRNTFMFGLLTNLSNPKVIIYFGSVFSPFLNGSVQMNALLKWELLALIIFETFIWFTIVALLFGLPPMQRFYQKQSVWIDGLAGLFFAGFGGHLIVSLNLTSFTSIITP